MKYEHGVKQRKCVLLRPLAKQEKKIAPAFKEACRRSIAKQMIGQRQRMRKIICASAGIFAGIAAFISCIG